MNQSKFDAKVKQLTGEFNEITGERKLILSRLRTLIQTEAPANLNFICTHNSRRSQMAQVWAHAAANLFGFHDVRCFSSGTEVSAVHPNTLEALRQSGFAVTQLTESKNTQYHVSAGSGPPALVYSKLIGDEINPTSAFIAVMTCSNADQNCPFVPGATQRVSLNYDDPGKFDSNPGAVQKYLETSDRIGREMLYIFSGKD